MISPPTSTVADDVLPRIANGESQAVDECLSRYSALVWSLARRYCRTLSDAEDAVQDIFVEVWQKACKFDSSKASESTFIAMIARRRLIDRHRRASAQIETVNLDNDNVDVSFVELESAPELADEAAKAAACLRKLSEQQRQVITRSVHHGHPHSAISKALNMPIGTVKSYARRGLLQLRECMLRQTSNALQTDGGAS